MSQKVERLKAQMAERIASGVPFANTGGHADGIYLPDVVEYIAQLEAEREPVTKDDAMVERAARALLGEHEPEHDWEYFDAETHEQYRTMARAALDAALAVQPKRCESCDDTGDLVRADGEWLGNCPCGGKARTADAED